MWSSYDDRIRQSMAIHRLWQDRSPANLRRYLSGPRGGIGFSQDHCEAIGHLQAQVREMDALVRQIAWTTPRAGAWESSYRALHFCRSHSRHCSLSDLKEIGWHGAIQQELDQILDGANLFAERQRCSTTKKQSVLDITGQRCRQVMVNTKLTESFDAVAQPALLQAIKRKRAVTTRFGSPLQRW